MATSPVKASFTLYTLMPFFFAEMWSIESIPVPHLEITFNFLAFDNTSKLNSSSPQTTPS